MKHMKPILLINLKAYEKGIGGKALEISRIADSFGGGKAEIIVSAQPTDIRMISEKADVPVFAQHVDPVECGSKTGWIPPESVKAAGATGTLLNHSERQIDNDTIKKSLERCRKVGLRTVVCADTPERAKEIAALGPDYIAIEPPELIGGDVSVSKAKPEIITQSVEKVSEVADVPVLCGAGVKNGEDVRKATELGSKGILIASGVVKAEDPKKAIKDLMSGF